MFLNTIQLSQLKEWILPQFELKKRIEQLVEILIEDIIQEPPVILEKLLKKYSISMEQFNRMTPGEQIDTMSEIWKKQKTKSDNIIVALDMIFNLRYGWPEGTIASMPVSDLLLALDHAMEYDDPSKPSIWEITK